MRTDAHRPSAIDPACYVELGAYYCGISDDMGAAYLPEHIALTDMGIDEDELHHSKCDHCGQRFAHGVLYRHIPTSDLVHVGHICAAETMSLSSRAALVRKRAEDAARTARERREALESQRADVLAAHEALRNDDGALWDNLRGSYGGFIADLHSKVTKWTLSDRQADAYVKGYASAKERSEKPKAADKPRGQALEGRQVVTGKCVAIKDYANDYGGYSAATVVVPQGDAEVVVWVKLTSTWYPEKGEQTTFKATFKPKDDGFSIGSRATTKGL